MSTPQRRQPTGVVARLLAEPHRFGFFQAVRVLNRWLSKGEGVSAGRGLSSKLFFRNNLSLSFPASEIAQFKLTTYEVPLADGSLPPKATALMAGALGDRADIAAAATKALVGTTAEEVERIEMTPAFMSLLGTGGALPIFYSEVIAEREGFHRDTAARSFLDIFQHRAISLFYGAWRKHRLPMQYEDDDRNRYLPLMLAVAGIGQNALRDRLHGDEGGVADDTLAHFAGLLQQRPVSSGVIRQIVAEYFAVPVALDQFIGRWFTLPGDSTSRLGSANATLGADAVMGERVWQRDLRMRLTMGPMTRAKLERFLPGGEAALALHELLTLMTGVSLEYEVRLALRANEVQGSRLDDGPTGARLGWDSFLVTEPSKRPRDDAGYDIHALH